MDNPIIGSLLAGRRPTPVVVAPPPTEIVPYKIPAGIIDYVLANRYAGDRHPGEHLLYLSQLCSLFKLAGVSREFVMRKLFALSLKGKALEWYRLLNDSHLLEWEEIQSLFYSKFYPLHEVHENRNYVYNFYPHDGESIAQAWGRLKTLMLKCPNHGLPKDAYVESKSTFLHVDHGNNALCDAYIVEFIRDPTENYYEKGTYAYRYFNNIKFPFFMLKVLKLHLFCLPMLIALCFNELFYCNFPMHRKHVRLKCVWYLLLDALFCSSTLIPTRASLKS